VAQKTQNGRYPGKIALRLKKVCYKVSLCEQRQRQSCRAFTGVTIRAKMIGGERPLKRKFCIKQTTSRLRCRVFTDCDECSICIAIITMEYQIINNVH